MNNENSKSKAGDVPGGGELANVPAPKVGVMEEVDLEDSAKQEKEEQAPTSEPEKAPVNKKKRILWAVAGILLVVVVAVAIAVPLAKRGEDEPTSAPISTLGGKPSSPPELTVEVMTRVYDTVFMTKALFDDDPTQKVPGAAVYRDESLLQPDAALLVRKENTCFAIFRATTSSIVDWIQNIPKGPPTKFQSARGKNCFAIDAYHSAYFGSNFVDQFRDDVHECVAGCGDEPCELVVGGHSQGAGIAAVAAVDMDDLNPLVLSSNQPPALVEEGKGPCKAINPNRYLRFINTYVNSDSKLGYDPVASLGLQETTDWLGHLFVLSDNEEGLPHYPNYARPNIPLTLWSQDAHFMVDVLPKLKTLMNSKVFPISTDGWENGAICNFNDECQSKLCHENKCIAAGSNGAPCTDASDCDSGRCDGVTNAVCRPKLDAGAWCTEASDCLSGKCSVGKKCQE